MGDSAGRRAGTHRVQQGAGLVHDGATMAACRLKRGGGGMVSGLSAVADDADMLWVCAALSDDDRAAARSCARRAARSGAGGRRCGRAHARHPAGRSSTGPTTPSRTPPCGSCTTCCTTRLTGRASGRASRASGRRSAPTTRCSPLRSRAQRPAARHRLRRGSRRRGRLPPDRRAGPGGDPGLSPLPDAPDARRARSRHPDRALLAHAVGAARLLPDAAGRRRPRGPGRHTRRRSRRLLVPALGGRVRRLLRRLPRRGGRRRAAARSATAATSPASASTRSAWTRASCGNAPASGTC